MLVALASISLSKLFVLGIQVLNQNKRHSGVGRQVFKKLFGRLETTGRRADPDHRKRCQICVYRAVSLLPGCRPIGVLRMGFRVKRERSSMIFTVFSRAPVSWASRLTAG